MSLKWRMPFFIQDLLASRLGQASSGGSCCSTRQRDELERSTGASVDYALVLYISNGLTAGADLVESELTQLSGAIAKAMPYLTVNDNTRPVVFAKSTASRPLRRDMLMITRGQACL